MLIAAECEHRRGLHVNADHLCVELGPPAEGMNGDGPRDVIVTDLHNYGMPLLRYANGDLATQGSGACSCGRGLPLLAMEIWQYKSGDPLVALKAPRDGIVAEVQAVEGEFVEADATLVTLEL